MLTMFIRALILYVAVILIIRLMGKRQVGQLQPFELVFTVIVSDLAATPMSDVGMPLLYGILPVGALLLAYALISILCLKSEKARGFLAGRPTVLIRNGVIDQKALLHQGFTINELLERVRSSGIYNIHEVGCALLEVSGQLSVFPVSQKRPATPEDLGLATPYEGLPLNLVLDGRMQSDTLRLAGKDEAWLEHVLKELGATPKAVFYCALDTSGLLTVQRRQGERLQYLQALDASEVKW